MSGGRIWLRQVLFLAWKELVQLWRDRPLLMFIVYIFTLNVVLAGSDASRELNHARLVYFDHDHSAASRDLTYRFRDPYFRNLGSMNSAAEGRRALEKGDAIIFLEIPERFEQSLLGHGSPTEVQELVDTSKSSTGYLAASYSGQIIAAFTAEWAAKANRTARNVRIPSISNQTRIWYNQRLDESWFSAIAELLMMLTVSCMLLPSSAMMREKERGTIEQLLVCPLSPFQILLAKALAMTLVMLVGTSTCLYWVLHGMFHVPMRGSTALFLALTAAFTFTNAGIGFVIASYSRNSAQAGMMALMIAMPMIMLSGTWTPLDSMPPMLQSFMNLSPMRHYIEISYAIMLRGAGFRNLLPSIVWMVSMGLVLFGLGLWRFRRQFA